MSEEPRGFVPVDQYVTLVGNEETWLIRNLLPVGGSMLIHAQEKAGKSAMAIQLAMALTGALPDWLGFQIDRHGRVLYLQVDTPRTTWSRRFRVLMEAGYAMNPDMVRIADRQSLGLAALNVLDPAHVQHLKMFIESVADEPVPVGATYSPEPVAIVVDTLRKCQLADENSNTEQQLVYNRLEEITAPSSLIMIAHSKKPQMGAPADVISTNRGAGSVTAAVDAIIQLRPKRMVYVGRDIEEGKQRLEKHVVYAPHDKAKAEGVLLWKPTDDRVEPAVAQVLQDMSLTSLREHGRVLAKLINKSEDAATKQLARFIQSNKGVVPANKAHLL